MTYSNDSYPVDIFSPPPVSNQWPPATSATFDLADNTFKYTPIVIQFRPPILDDSGSPYVDKEGKHRYALRISTPASNRQGENQYIPDSFYYPVPEDGLVRMYLVPSDRYLPVGRYVVEYYRIGHKLPLLKERWIVPQPPPMGSFSFTYQAMPPILPIDVWKVVTVSAGEEWVSNFNSLTWGMPPALGAEVTIRYKRAVTLDKLIDRKLNQSKDIDRIRY